MKQQRNFKEAPKKERKLNVDMIIPVAFDPEFEDFEPALELLGKNDVYEQFAIPVFAYRTDVMNDPKAKRTNTIIVGHINKFELPENEDPIMSVNVYGINADAVTALVGENGGVLLPVFRKRNDKYVIVKFIITTVARIEEEAAYRKNKVRK